ncbi:MAG: glycosyltransferase family 2 protein [Thermoplasmata archaeon]|nr:glycosyltransferase family 2 protein [Thermoplasmata archaeon]
MSADAQDLPFLSPEFEPSAEVAPVETPEVRATSSPSRRARPPVVRVDELTLIVPSHNEAESIRHVLRECWADRPRGVAMQILVVDDASTDDTPKILRELQSEFPIRVIRNPVSRGFGGALKVGIANTRTRWVAFTDADGQYDPRDLPILLAVLESGNELALGWRTQRADPFVRTAISVGFRGLLFLFFHHAAHDPTTSLRAGRTETIRNVAARTRYMNGSFWNEFMVRWRAENYSFAEVPVRHLPRYQGKSKVAARSVISKVSAQQFIALLRVWREFHRDATNGTSLPALAGDPAESDHQLPVTGPFSSP